MGPFYFFLTVFSNCNSCIGGFGPFEILGDPFPRGPQGLVPPPPPPLESFLQPWHAVHLFPANLGDSECISEIVQAISAVRQFGGRSGMVRQSQCRNWLLFYRITYRLSKIGRKRVYITDCCRKIRPSHGWRIVETRGGAFPLVAVQFKAKWWITAVLHRYKPNMNVKTTITLIWYWFELVWNGSNWFETVFH